MLLNFDIGKCSLELLRVYIFIRIVVNKMYFT